MFVEQVGWITKAGSLCRHAAVPLVCILSCSCKARLTYLMNDPTLVKIRSLLTPSFEHTPESPSGFFGLFAALAERDLMSPRFRSWLPLLVLYKQGT